MRFVKKLSVLRCILFLLDFSMSKITVVYFLDTSNQYHLKDATKNIIFFFKLNFK